MIELYFHITAKGVNEIKQIDNPISGSENYGSMAGILRNLNMKRRKWSLTELEKLVKDPALPQILVQMVKDGLIYKVR